MSRKKKPDETREGREDRMLADHGYRKSDELEAQADQILHKDILDAIRNGFDALKLPSNDPEYLKRLQTSEAARNAIANKLTQVDLVPDGNKTYLGVGSFTHGEAREIAQMLSGHFELKIRQHE